MNATLLGRLLPMAHEQEEVHTIRLPVPPDEVWAALHAIGVPAKPAGFVG